MPRNRLQKKDFSIHKDAEGNVAGIVSQRSQLHAPPERTLTPASTGTLNSMNGLSPSPLKQAMARTSTIRSVPSFEASDSSPESKNSGLSSSINSNGSAMSAMADSHHEQTPSSIRLKREPSMETPSRWAAASPRVIEPSQDKEAAAVLSDGADADAQWDATIGKAGLGKTGRVINKLVSDNEALKRDIQIERLRSEEAKQAAKLVEDKMERMVQDYESRLLEANVTKTLLARKERQVESLQAAVEAEKRKTTDAQDKERGWRAEMDKMRSETTAQVDDATSYAQLMEGRYNAISSHWQEQGDKVNQALSKMREEIAGLVEERRKDDEKIQTLRDLCDQQDGNIRQLKREKDDIAQLFEDYKRTQEDALKDIKTNARKREDEQERLLGETREALAKLRWALNVKENVKGAQ